MAKPTLGSSSSRRRSKRDWRRQFRYFYWRFVRLRSTPEEIARGLAVGVFAGWYPIFGLQIAVGILLATLVRGNRWVAAAGTWVSNPLTYVPIYAFNYHVGQWLLGSKNQIFSDDSLLSWQKLTQLGTEFLTTLFVGCFVVGAICAFFSYFLGLWLAHRVQRRRLQRRRAKRLD
ncbi:DUF2062 domain-containing protein [Leptolyngbya sp. FACHB-261]|uniref:DUF2062 domain-containing protein n=1 Tax=Leptolyngbya sp. FACHB-261 TaxID=2692806 RepID=UPI0028C469CB|nr:DUF2062 domain-containing protein [Leptolyngbya sp. FACHB-261]